MNKLSLLACFFSVKTMWINGGRCDLTEKKSVCKVSVKAIGSDAAAHSWHDAFVCGYFSPFFTATATVHSG